MLNPFTPMAAGTVSITNAVTSARVALGTKYFNQVRIKNLDATNIAYVAFGDVTVVATVPAGATGGSFPVGPNESIIVSLAPNTTHAASICSAGTPIVMFTPGNGQ